MKKVFAIALTALFVGGVALTSCSKYEEGPKLTLLTKKMRLAGTWGVSKYLENGVDKTSDYRVWTSAESLTYEKDGTYSVSTTTIMGTGTFSGTWEFINDKEDVKTTTTVINGVTLSTPSIDTIHITKLKNKEMWRKEVDGTDTYEYHYESK
jgi:hypothetical protein